MTSSVVSNKVDISAENLKFNSLLFSFFFAESHLCGIIDAFVHIPNISVFVVASLFMVSVIYNRSRIRLFSKDCFFIVIIFFLFAVSLIINGSYAIQYLIFFIVFGITGFYFISIPYSITKMQASLNFVFFAYLVVYIFVIRRTFLGSSNYWSRQMPMSFSFYMIIATSAIDLVLTKNKKRAISLFNAVLSLFFLFVDCGTRGALFSVVLLALCISIYLSNKKALITTVISGGILLMAYLNIESILRFLVTVTDGMGLTIGALSKTIWKLKNNGTVLNGRERIYDIAFQCIKLSPLLGNGIGGFERIYNNSTGLSSYPHQFFLEIVCEYGFIGAIIILFVIFKPVVQIFSSKSKLISESKISGLLFLSCSMLMLMFNNSYWLLPSFWVFMAWCIASRREIENGGQCNET